MENRKSERSVTFVRFVVNQDVQHTESKLLGE